MFLLLYSRLTKAGQPVNHCHGQSGLDVGDILCGDVYIDNGHFADMLLADVIVSERK